MLPPGKIKFKLRTIPDQEYLGRPLQVCDELAFPRCTHCHEGFIYVAYGEVNKVMDVYKFPCHCTHPIGGYELWMMDSEENYRDRPAEYQCLKKDLPRYVYIHPKNNREAVVNLMRRIRQIQDRLQAEKGEEVPF